MVSSVDTILSKKKDTFVAIYMIMRHQEMSAQLEQQEKSRQQLPGPRIEVPPTLCPPDS